MRRPRLPRRRRSDQRYNGSQNRSQAEGQQRARQAEPRGQQRHQLGVAQAHAFTAADEFVEPADKQDQGRSGEDS